MYGVLCDSVIFSLKMVLVTRMPEPPYRMAGRSKKMAAEQYVYIILPPPLYFNILKQN
jgi:hypothetical protein